MRKLLQEISVIPGVTGSCIFDKKEGPLCKLLQQELGEEDLETVGIHLVRLVQMGAVAGLDIHTSHFRFDRYTLIGIPLDQETILVTICDAQANCSLVSTTASMLARDMRSDLEHGEPAESGAESDQTAEEDETFLHLLYDEIEQALAAAMGPVAALVMGDCLDRWRQAGPAIPGRVSELISMLEGEIGNPDLARAFTERVEKLL
jgi:hypothetical protein